MCVILYTTVLALEFMPVGLEGFRWARPIVRWLRKLALPIVIVGIGLNVNNDPPSIEPAATSLKKIMGRRVSRKEILSRYLNEFEAQMQAAAYDDVIERWKQFTVTLNRHVRVVTTRKVYKGKAVDVDDTGALILECADGSLKTIRYGDCFHQTR